MKSEHPIAQLKRRSFFAAAAAGLAGIAAGAPLLRRFSATAAAPSAAPSAPPPEASTGASPEPQTLISIHPMAIPRTEKREKTHG